MLNGGKAAQQRMGGNNTLFTNLVENSIIEISKEFACICKSAVMII